MHRGAWVPFLALLVAGMTGLLVMGLRTYRDAPPMPDFVAPSGEVHVARELVLRGQSVFLQRGLMDYGSMFGDGAGRGPDFTADALHRIAVAIQESYAEGAGDATWERSAAAARAVEDLKNNTYDAATGRVQLTAAQARAFDALVEQYRAFFRGTDRGAFEPAGYIREDAEIEALSAFFYWGAWVCSARRPGQATSYTHDWPYDPAAGNRPGSAVVLWSVFGLLALVLALGLVLYAHGRMDRFVGFLPAVPSQPIATVARIAAFTPTPAQRAVYPYFVVALVLFLLQVVAGIFTIHDFVGLTRFGGTDVAETLPIPVVRGWHVQMSILWIATCWIAGSIFLLPLASGTEPRGQTRLVHALLALLAIVVGGSFAGIFLGPRGFLGDAWRWLGSQGWEFVELGRLWHVILFAALGLWAVIVWRGLRPVLGQSDPWSLPHWLLYTITAVLALFVSGFVARPDTNFVIADFWRWMVIHMWVEAFLEVFTTVVVAYFLVTMGLVSPRSAARVVYLAALLFLGSGILGISHNFYWNAKPVMTLAIGSVFSTLQVVPLVLLMLEAWRMRRLPREILRRSGGRDAGRTPVFGQDIAFAFLLAVNFWNFMGAGVFGLIINLPIMNYFEHGTYLTVNHGHSALMGVYGNLSLAAFAFCGRYLIRPERWSDRGLRVAFWSLNCGLALMVLLDLFPAGILQFVAVLDHGLWYGRSQDFVLGAPFQTLTWLRIVGGALFVLGGVVPITLFACTRTRALKPAQPPSQALTPVAEPEAARAT